MAGGRRRVRRRGAQVRTSSSHAGRRRGGAQRQGQGPGHCPACAQPGRIDAGWYGKEEAGAAPRLARAAVSPVAPPCPCIQAICNNSRYANINGSLMIISNLDLDTFGVGLCRSDEPVQTVPRPPCSSSCAASPVQEDYAGFDMGVWSMQSGKNTRDDVRGRQGQRTTTARRRHLPLSLLNVCLTPHFFPARRMCCPSSCLDSLPGATA